MLKRYPLFFYFAITFTVSWGFFLTAIGGFKGLPGTPEQLEKMLPMAILAMLAGPSFAGLLMTGLVSGKAGLRQIVSRMLNWRVSAPWYAVALLAAPLTMVAALSSVSFISAEFLPDILASENKLSLLLMGITGGLTVGIFEELGWTNFAVPLLQQRYGILSTGLIVGVVWGAWHILTNGLWASAMITGTLSPNIFLPLYILLFLVGQLPAFRVLMVWVYDRTGSLLVVMLMHASLTSVTLILGSSVTGVNLLILCLAYAVTAWLLVAAITLTNFGIQRQSETPRGK